jgi:cell wall-associated NlpC family hydrolase
MITRAQVVAKAREFMDTPFKDQHRMKGKRGGIDCVGLVLLTAEELGICYTDTALMRGSDYLNYNPQSVNSQVLQECTKRLVNKPVKDIRAGDIVVMRAGSSTPSHAAIITSGPGGILYMIHAYNGGPMKVVEHIMDVKWQRRIAGAFSYPGVEEVS